VFDQPDFLTLEMNGARASAPRFLSSHVLPSHDFWED